MIYVRQEGKYGCVIACMAMILEMPYKTVNDKWISHNPKIGVSEGVDALAAVSFMFEMGWIGFTTYKTKGWTKEKREPSEWIKEFAPIHIVTTITTGPHAIVWYNGKIYDPNIDGEQDIRNYEVIGITGYYPLTSKGKG